MHHDTDFIKQHDHRYISGWPYVSDVCFHCLQSWRWCLQVWVNPWAPPSGLHTGCDITQFQCQTKCISWGTLHTKTYEEIVKEVSTYFRKPVQARHRKVLTVPGQNNDYMLTCLGPQTAKWYGRWQGRWKQPLRVWIVSYPYCLLVKALYLPLKRIHNTGSMWTVSEC